LGHAVTSYFGFLIQEGLHYIWEAISHPEVYAATKEAMWESANALIMEYPEEFDKKNQRAHIEDLLSRFANKMLGDTIFRVGRDLPRKLSPEDRLIGALRMQRKHNIFNLSTLLGIAGAMLFRERDENGNYYKSDDYFINNLYPQGIPKLLTAHCGLNGNKENNIIQVIDQLHAYIKQTPAQPDRWRKQAKNLVNKLYNK